MRNFSVTSFKTGLKRLEKCKNEKKIKIQEKLTSSTENPSNTNNNKTKKQTKMSHVLKNGTVNPGSEVAAKVNDLWIHARVVQWNQDTKCYEVEDADTEESASVESDRYQVMPCNVIPLVVPRLKEKIQQGSRVLALFPWTTSFYAGTVVSTGPKKYGVRFDDDKEEGKIVKKRKIPHYFVVKHPNQAAAVSQISPTSNSSASASSPPFGFEHAITYVTKIKTRFEHDSTKYTTFLDILHAYKEDKQSIEGVLEEVSELFRDHPDLLKEFAYFLPEAVQAQATARLAQAAAHYKRKKHEIPTTELPLDVASLKKKYDKAQKVAEEAQKIADDLLFKLNELMSQEASKA